MKGNAISAMVEHPAAKLLLSARVAALATLFETMYL